MGGRTRGPAGPHGSVDHSLRREGPIEPECLFLDVDEDRGRAFVQQAIRRGDEAEWCREDFVPLADLEGTDAKVEPGRPAGARDRFASVRDSRDPCFEAPREFTKGENITLEHFGDQFQLARPDVWSSEGDGSVMRLGAGCTRVPASSSIVRYAKKTRGTPVGQASTRNQRSIGRAGTPTTVVSGGTDLVTQAPAPITASSPMVMGTLAVPLMMTAPVPT